MNIEYHYTIANHSDIGVIAVLATISLCLDSSLDPQSIVVDSVVIDAGFDRENHGTISRNFDRRGLKLLDVRTDPRIRLDGSIIKQDTGGKKNSLRDFVKFIHHC
jgi:hypothetical protein